MEEKVTVLLPNVVLATVLIILSSIYIITLRRYG